MEQNQRKSSVGNKRGKWVRNTNEQYINSTNIKKQPNHNAAGAVMEMET